MTRRMYDAAWPPTTPPPWEVVAGYLGGNTPHVWSPAEWAAQPARYRLPIWTRSNPAGHDGTAEGQEAVRLAKALGQPAGTAIALDYEQAVDAVYLEAFDAAVRAAGFFCVVYGAESFVLQNPKPSAGYWLANWNNPSQPYLDPRSTATQYASDTQLGTSYDASLVSDALMLWDTTPTPDPAPSPGEDTNMHVDLGLNKPVVVTNPAAVKGGTTAFTLSTDFGDAVVRVAQFSMAKNAWDSVVNHSVPRVGGAVRLDLGGDVNKVSFEVTSVVGPAVVGLDVIS